MSQEEKVKVNYTKFNRLTLRKTLDDNKSEAVLNWIVRETYPRITVITNSSEVLKDNKINRDKIITATFDYVNIKLLINEFKNIILSDNDTEFTVNSYNIKYVDGKKTDEIELRAQVVIGKKDGVHFIKLIERNKDVITFELLPANKWFKYEKNNEPIKDKKMLSLMYTKAYYELLVKAFDEQFKEDYKTVTYVDKANDLS